MDLMQQIRTPIERVRAAFGTLRGDDQERIAAAAHDLIETKYKSQVEQAMRESRQYADMEAGSKNFVQSKGAFALSEDPYIRILQLSGTGITGAVNEFRKGNKSRQASFLYDTSGTAKMIVDRNKTFVYELGFDLSLDFAPGFPKVEAELLNDFLYTDFWESKELRLQKRIAAMITEKGIWGEHFWRTKVYPDGSVILGDLRFDQVEEVIAMQFDPMTQTEVVLRGSGDKADRTLSIVHTSRDLQDMLRYKHLVGEVFMFTMGDRAESRGMSLLQQIVDELGDQKAFFRQSLDKVVYLLHTFLDVTLDGAEDEDIKEFENTVGTRPPAPGSIAAHNQDTTYKWNSPDVQATQIDSILKTVVANTIGTLGYPVSWHGYGDGSTRATAATQQYPVFADFKTRQADVVFDLERIVQYVADQHIISGAVGKDRTFEREIRDKQTDEVIGKIPTMLRDGILIKVSPRSLPVESDEVYGAIKVAADVIYKDILAEAEGANIMTEQDRLDLMNDALRKDKVGIELRAQADSEAKNEEDEGADDGDGNPDVVDDEALIPIGAVPMPDDGAGDE